MMPTQDTITIPRDLGAWLDACHLEPRSTPGVDQERYTAKAAHGLLARARDAKPLAALTPTTSTDWSRAQDKRIAQLTGEHSSLLDDVSRLRQELATAKAAYSEKIATFEDNRASSLAARSAKAGRELRRDPHEVVIRVIIEQPPLTPATTPEQDATF